MLHNFQTYQLGSQFYQLVCKLRLPRHLQQQLLRAASSIPLNLAEGYGRFHPKEKAQFYQIALGSQRECKAILELGQVKDEEILLLLDRLGACNYKLIKRVRG